MSAEQYKSQSSEVDARAITAGVKLSEFFVEHFQLDEYTNLVVRNPDRYLFMNAAMAQEVLEAWDIIDQQRDFSASCVLPISKQNQQQFDELRLDLINLATPS